MDEINISLQEINNALTKTGKFRIVNKPQKWLTISTIHVKIVHSDRGSSHLAKLVAIANKCEISVDAKSDEKTSIETDARSLYYGINIASNSNINLFIQLLGESQWL